MKSVWALIQNEGPECYFSGTVFRTKAKYPYEDQVDFMLFSDADSDSGLSLLVSSGYKAGTVLLRLPQEARFEEQNKLAISAKWLLNNWKRWVYDSDTAEVKWTLHYLCA